MSIRATDASNASTTRAIAATVVANDEAPTVDVADVDPGTRAGPVEEITITFSEGVSGFSKDNLVLTRQDDASETISLEAATLTTTDNRVWTLGGLAGGTGNSGIYRLTLSADGIVDGTGNALVAGDEVSWINGPGDANRDNKFDQNDIIAMLQAARYRTGEPATWSQGDFNGDGFFDQSDVIQALRPAHYLAGLFAATSQVILPIDSQASLSSAAEEITVPRLMNTPSGDAEEVAVPTFSRLIGDRVAASGPDDEASAVDLVMEDDLVRLV